MKVVILCGGQGTRMREETEFKPKPLVEIGGKPVLWHIMKLFAHHRQNDFCLALGYKGDLIKQYFLNYEPMNTDFTITLGKNSKALFHGAHTEQDMKVTLADTGLETMTGARVKRVAPYLDDDTFMVTYGDGVSDIDIEALLAFHKSHGKLATVSAHRPISRYGVLDIDSDHRVTSFAEKPQIEGTVSMGFFVFQKKVLDYIDDDITCNLEREPLQKLAREGELMAFKHEGFFHPMDTYRDYLALNEMWEKGNAPWVKWRRSDIHQEKRRSVVPTDQKKKRILIATRHA